MPFFRGVKCEISIDSEALEEWGETRPEGSNQINCYVQSEAEKRFRLTVIPTIPFNEEIWNEKQRRTRSAKVRGYH